MIKRLLVLAHNKSHFRMRSINNTMANHFLNLGENYIDTLDYACNQRDRAIQEVIHKITFELIRLWR